jgi:magnesium transporter
MKETTEAQTVHSRIDELSRALDSGAAGQVRSLLGNLHPAEIADVLESFPHGPREILWELVDPEDHGETLLHVNDEVRTGLIDEMDTTDLLAATDGLDTDDLVDLLQDLPDTLTMQVLHSMDKQNRERLESVLRYPEDSAGGMMDVDVVTVRADVELDVVLRYLRIHGNIPEMTDSLFVVDRAGKYRGMLPLLSLVTNDPNNLVATVMDREIRGIPASPSMTWSTLSARMQITRC